MKSEKVCIVSTVRHFVNAFFSVSGEGAAQRYLRNNEVKVNSRI